MHSQQLTSQLSDKQTMELYKDLEAKKVEIRERYRELDVERLKTAQAKQELAELKSVRSVSVALRLSGLLGRIKRSIRRG
jgi:hypothetical protein